MIHLALQYGIRSLRHILSVIFLRAYQILMTMVVFALVVFSDRVREQDLCVALVIHYAET